MGRSEKSHFWFRVFWQALSVFLLAVILGMVINMSCSTGLNPVRPRVLEQSSTADTSPAFEITLDEAFSIFNTGKAVFLDARSPETYDNGHIPGALNLPWNEFEERCDKVLGPVPPDTLVITYCDGEGCPLGDYLAEELTTGGYFNVRVLTSGWIGWIKEGFPLEKND